MSSNAERTDEAADDGLVTREEVEESVGVLGGILDNITAEDEFLAALLSNQVQMARVNERTSELIEEMRLARGADVTGHFPHDMSHNVPADTPTTGPVETVRVPDEQSPSRLTAVSLGWDDGTNHKVGIQLRTGSGEKLIPRNAEDQFLAFNDFTETFEMRKALEPGEELVARTVNLNSGSGTNFVNIVPHIAELEEESTDGGGDD